MSGASLRVFGLVELGFANYDLVGLRQGSTRFDKVRQGVNKVAPCCIGFCPNRGVCFYVRVYGQKFYYNFLRGGQKGLKEGK